MSFEESEIGLEVSVIDSLQILSSSSKTTTPRKTTHNSKEGSGYSSSSPTATVATAMTESTMLSLSSSSLSFSRRRSSSISSSNSTTMLATSGGGGGGTADATGAASAAYAYPGGVAALTPSLPLKSSMSKSTSSESCTNNVYYTFDDNERGGLSSSSSSADSCTYSSQTHSRSSSYELEYSDEDLSIVGEGGGEEDATSSIGGDKEVEAFQDDFIQVTEEELAKGTMSNEFDLGPQQLDLKSHRTKSTSNLHRSSNSINNINNNNNNNYHRKSSSVPVCTFPSARTFDLVIDELPKRNHPSTATTTTAPTPTTPTTLPRLLPLPKLTPAPSASAMETSKTPLPRPNLNHYSHEESSSKTKNVQEHCNVATNVFSSFVDNLWTLSSHNEAKSKSNTEKSPKVNFYNNINNSNTSSPSRSPASTTSSSSSSNVVKNLDYTIKECIKEGWLNKKGTGNDLFQSTCWKPRWCSLVLANIQGYENDVPLLLVSWQFAVKPSNIIVLNSTVAIKIDNTSNHKNNVMTAPSSTSLSSSTSVSLLSSNQDNSKNKTYCFDLISTKQESTNINQNCYNNNHNTSCSSSTLTTTSTLYTGKVTRSFSTLTFQERNEWVQKINETIEFRNSSSNAGSIRRRRRLLMSRNSNGGGGGGMNSTIPPTSPIRRLRRNDESCSGGYDEKFDLSGLHIAC